MRKALSLGLLAALLATPVLAQDWGQFAPEETALYVRIADVQAQVAKGPENWEDQLDGLLAMLPARDADEIGPVLDEFRNFFNSVQSMELALDEELMPIFVAALGPDSPKALSEDFQKFLERVDEGMTVTPTSITVDEFSLKLSADKVIVVYGESTLKRLEERMAGGGLMSLATSERFSAWSAAADGDFSLWLDCVRLQNAAEGVDRDLSMAMDFFEWQKWDTLSLNVYTTATSAKVVADVVLQEPLAEAAVWLKDSGPFELASKMPASSYGFFTAQLGEDHPTTYQQLLEFFHVSEQRAMKASAVSEIEWLEMEVENNKAMAEAAGPEDKVYYEEQLQYYNERLAEAREMAANDEIRPFMPDSAARAEAGIMNETEAEEFKEGAEGALADFGLTADQVLAAIGNEMVAGILESDYAASGPDDFEALWYVVIETVGDVQPIRDGLVNGLRDQGMPMYHAEVAGGELFREDSPFPEATVFIGPGIVGIAGCDEAALRVLDANAGNGRFDVAALPSGSADGSKMLYVDLGAVVGMILKEMTQSSRRYLNPPEVAVDIDEILPRGLKLEGKTVESAQRITVTFLAEGEANFDSVFGTVEDNVASQMAIGHDDSTLAFELTTACQQWLAVQGEKLADRNDADRKAFLANIHPESLRDMGYLQASDGLRSAHDPQFKDNLKAMLDGEREGLGDDAADLSQSGFRWHGLPTDIWPYTQDGGMWGDYKNLWVVAASREAWAKGGRQALIFTTDFQTVWLPEDVYQAAIAANSEGRRLASIPELGGESPPLWKVRRMLRSAEWELYDLTYQLENYQSMHGKMPVLDFNGADHDDPLGALKKALDIGPDDWFNVSNAGDLTVVCDGETYRVRVTRHGHWVEITSDGETRASWQQDTGD